MMEFTSEERDEVVEMDGREFAEAVRDNGATVSCTEPGCEWVYGQADFQEAPNAYLDHLRTDHGKTGEEAKQSQAKVKIHIYRCPRCQVRYRNAEDLKALSRADNKTEICNACATDEALESMTTGMVTSVRLWPIIPKKIKAPHGFQAPDWRDQRSNRSHRPSPAPTPRELPGLRLHLLERWVEGGVFDSYAHAASGGDYESVWERQMLRNASLWWIKDEMVDLTTAAARTIPTEVKCNEIELPADQAYGLAVLAKPWVGGLDAENPENTVTVDAVVWGPSSVAGVPCLTLSFYQYIDFAGGMTPSELQAATQSGLINEAKREQLPDGSGRLLGGAWMWLGRTDWPLDATIDDFSQLPTHFRDSSRRREAMMEDRRWFTALCVLVNHRLSTQETIYAARQTRRRAERAGVASEAVPSTVRLIRLRQARHEHPEGDEPTERKHVEWNHRWMVSGHMAWRRCGPRREQRRLVFVTPHVKGPEDLPLVLKDEVRVWVR